MCDTICGLHFSIFLTVCAFSCYAYTPSFCYDGYTVIFVTSEIKVKNTKRGLI